MNYTSWGLKESDTTEQLSTQHTHSLYVGDFYVI